jgi:predicted transcriptional regulator
MGDNPGVHKIELHQPKKAFAIIPNKAVRDPNITANAFRLLAYLLSHNDGYELTYRQIEKQTGLGRYAINAASKQLGDLGWLRVEQTKLKNGQFGPKSWTLLTPDGDDSTAGEPVAGQSAPDGFHSGTANGLKKTIPIENKDLEKTTIENTKEFDDQFDEWWFIYPNRKGKQAAKVAYKKALKKVSHDILVASAEKYRDDPNREDKYTPHPQRWLNEGRWDDEPEAPRLEKLTNAQKAAQLAMKYRAQAQQEQQAIETNIIDAEVVEEIASSWIKGVDEL